MGYNLKKGERLLYKLTNQNNQTQNNTTWGVKITNYAENQNPKNTNLCSSDVVHAYTNPILALIRNTSDANIPNPKLWLAKGIIVNTGAGIKCGCKSLTTIRELIIPTISLEQRIAFAIYSALSVYKERSFVLWTNNWLKNIDRTVYAANAANAAAYAATNAAYASDAATAANAAANAADAAVNAANAAVNAAYAAYAAMNAAMNAAVRAAANATADAAAYATKPLNFDLIAKKAMLIK